MRNFFPLLALASLIGSSTAVAAPNEEEARLSAARFLRDSAPREMRDAASLKLAYSSPEKNCFVYNTADSFVIVGGDMAGYEILGYSGSGTFNADNVPPQLMWLLGEYEREGEWMRLRKLAPSGSQKESYIPVAPLLGQIAYDQNSPYNLLCPTYWGNERSATGCAATAVAQIFRYHQYPEHGEGSNSYTPEFYPNMGQLDVDYSQSFYQWDLMPERYPADAETTMPAESAAVARLMYDCGTAMFMNYGPQSGALPIDIPYAAVNNFTYDEGIAYRLRAYYDGAEYDRIMREDIASGHPVFITGYTDTGGHAFVADGYDAGGYFHINWGWGGMSNGYFRMTSLTPATQGTGGSSGGFNARQVILTGITPATSADAKNEYVALLASEEGLTVPRTSFAKASKVKVSLNGKTYNVGWRNTTADFYLSAVNAEGVEVLSFPGDKGREVPLGGNTRKIEFPDVDFSSLADGDYFLYPMASESGGNVRERVRDMDLNFPNFLKLSISGDNAKVEYPMAAELVLNALDLNGEAYSGHKVSVTATLANQGDVEYYGDIRLALLDAGGTNLAQSDVFRIDLMPGDLQNVALSAIFTPGAGEYRLAVLNGTGHVIGEPQTVTYRENPGNGTLIAVQVPEVVQASTGNVSVKANFSAENGVFSGIAFVYIYGAETEDVYGCLESRFIQVLPGENKEYTFTGPFENGEVGRQYRAVLVDGEKMSFVTPRGTAQTTFTLGSSGVDETSAGNSGADIYRVDGTHAATTLWKGSPEETLRDAGLGEGLFIVRHNSDTYKIIIK